jgi:hypothetical protein
MQLHLPLSLLLCVVFHHLEVEREEGEIQREEVLGEEKRNRGNDDAVGDDDRSRDDGSGVCPCFYFYGEAFCLYFYFCYVFFCCLWDDGLERGFCCVGVGARPRARLPRGCLSLVCCRRLARIIRNS